MNELLRTRQQISVCFEVCLPKTLWTNSKWKQL